MIPDEIERHWLEKERHTIDIFAIKMSLPERLHASFETGLPLKGAVDHRPLMNSPAPIFPTERNVHRNADGTRSGCPPLNLIWSKRCNRESHTRPG